MKKTYCFFTVDAGLVNFEKPNPFLDIQTYLETEYLLKVGTPGSRLEPILAVYEDNYMEQIHFEDKANFGRSTFVSSISDAKNKSEMIKIKIIGLLSDTLFRIMCAIDSECNYFPPQRQKDTDDIERITCEFLAFQYRRSWNNSGLQRIRMVTLLETMCQCQHMENTLYTSRLLPPEMGYPAINLGKSEKKVEILTQIQYH